MTITTPILIFRDPEAGLFLVDGFWRLAHAGTGSHQRATIPVIEVDEQGAAVREWGATYDGVLITLENGEQARVVPLRADLPLRVQALMVRTNTAQPGTRPPTIRSGQIVVLVRSMEGTPFDPTQPGTVALTAGAIGYVNAPGLEQGMLEVCNTGVPPHATGGWRVEVTSDQIAAIGQIVVERGGFARVEVGGETHRYQVAGESRHIDRMLAFGHWWLHVGWRQEGTHV